MPVSLHQSQQPGRSRAPTSAAPDANAARKPSARARAFIVAYLLLQIGVPLHYYLGPRDYDERFSWRMFSTLRLRDCSIAVRERAPGAAPRAVDVSADVQIAWQRLLERMRGAVVDKYLARRCARGGIESVQFVGQCRDTDGRPLPELRRTRRCEPAP